MRNRLALVLVLVLPVVIAGVVTWYWNKPSGPVYRGMTAAQWSREMEQWEVDSSWQLGDGPLWHYRRPSAWRLWLAKLGLPVSVKPEPVNLELVKAIHCSPRADAIPILIELLNARDSFVRDLAAISLRDLAALDAKSVHAAVPALIAALKGTDESLRWYAESALEKIDPDGSWQAFAPSVIRNRELRDAREKADRKK